MQAPFWRELVAESSVMWQRLANGGQPKLTKFPSKHDENCMLPLYSVEGGAVQAHQQHQEEQHLPDGVPPEALATHYALHHPGIVIASSSLSEIAASSSSPLWMF
jgi:hypothetical protein